MRSRGLFASAFLMLAVPALSGYVPVRSAAAAETTQLRAHTGDVQIRRGKAGASPAPAAATPLFRRDEVETRGGTATVELPSGMLLELGQNSLFAIIGGGAAVDGFLARGQLAITPGNSGEARLVQIATGPARVDLRVREGRLEMLPDHVLLQVVNGTADVVVRQQKITVGSGQELEVRIGGIAGTPRPMAPPQVTAPPTPPEPVVAVTTPTPTPAPTTPTPVVASHPEPMAPPPALVPQPVAPNAPQVTPPPVLVAPQGPQIAVPPPTVAQAPAPDKKEPLIGLTTLRLLREKNLISQGQFESALRDLHDTVGPRGADSFTLVVGKFATTLYGFAQGDFMWHSTQGQQFNDFVGNFQIPRPNSIAGDNGRFQGSVRDSRVGVRVHTPELSWLRASAVLEMDFIGPSGSITTGTVTEGNFFSNPVLRVRHAYLKMETPVIDILFGQYWHLFGWQPNFVPAIMQWPGVVGNLYGRTMQLRLSKTIKSKPVNFEIAVAGLRPPQRDASMPEFQGGLRLSFNQWKAVHSTYMTSMAALPASIAVSADLRRFNVPEFSANPQNTNSIFGMGIAASLFLPIIPGTLERKDNSLAIIGEFVTGSGINDLYTGLSGGVTSPPVLSTNGMMSTPFNIDADAGLIVYDINGNLVLPTWTTFLVGAEYYLPRVGGRVGLFVNFSRTQLHNPEQYTGTTAALQAKVRDNEMMYDGGFFVDITSAIRFGIDYARFDDQYVDGVHAINNAVQMSGFLFF